jgi:hypothetical protein
LNTAFNLFAGCTSINIDTFKYIINRLPNTITTLEGAFLGCSGVVGSVYRSMLHRIPNVTSLKDAFSGTRLYGTLESRTSDYSKDIQSTWGFFDFVPKVLTIENAFSGT